MNKEKEKRHDWEHYLEVAAEVGSVAMSLRDKPTRLDWFGLVLRGVALGFRVRAARRAHVAKSPWSYFEDTGLAAEWVAVPDSLDKLVVDYVRDDKIVTSHWDGSPTSSRVYIGTLLGEERVGWVLDSEGDIADGPYIRADRVAETYGALGRAIWRRFGVSSLIFGKDGLAVDPYLRCDVDPGQQFRDILARANRFCDADVSRSYLFAGPPGTGKSTGIRYLATELAGTSLRVELAALSRTFARNHDSSLLASVETLVYALRPHTLIIDDIDRARDESQLLHFLELAAQSCKVVLASANCTSKMTGALLRPGRFDELIEVRHPDPQVVRALVGDDDALIARLRKLPVAYIAEFVKRRSVLGLEPALAELEELKKRRKRAEEGSD